MNTLSYLYLLWEVVGDGTPTTMIEYIMRVDSSLLPVFVIVSVRCFFLSEAGQYSRVKKVVPIMMMK